MKHSWTKYLLVVSLCCVGCPGGYDNKFDSTGPIMDGVKWDTTGNPQDGWPNTDKPQVPPLDGQPPDTYIPWPDVTYPDSQPSPDLFPWPPQDQGGYTPSPFGCQLDTDCFGIKCCPTPWGVKLCAPVCQY